MARNKLKYMGKEYPATVSPMWITISTHYDTMTPQERGIVFEAYRYNKKDDIYELWKPELLTDEIVEKIIIGS